MKIRNNQQYTMPRHNGKTSKYFPGLDYNDPEGSMERALMYQELLYYTPSINVVPVLDNIQKDIIFCPETDTMYLPIPWKKFRVRKHKSKKWHKRRQDKINTYVVNYLKGLGVKAE